MFHPDTDQFQPCLFSLGDQCLSNALLICSLLSLL